MTTTHLRLLDRTGQLMLVLSPLLFVCGLHLLRFGRDLTIVSLAGLAILLIVALFVAIVGCRRDKAMWQIAGVIAVGIVIVTCLRLPEGILWIGNKNAVVVLTIIDADTGLPVADAVVRIFEEDDAPQSSGRTDSRGTLRLHHHFVATGYSTFCAETGSYRVTRETLAVHADGYVAVRELLCKYTGSGARLYEELPDVEIRMKRQRE
jgi:hypothetical protein